MALYIVYMSVYILHAIYTVHMYTEWTVHYNPTLAINTGTFSSNQTVLEPATYLYPEQSDLTAGRQDCRRGINTCDQVLVSHCNALGKWFTPSCSAQCHKAENNNWKNSEGSHSFPSWNDTRLRSGWLPSADIKVAVINLHTPFSSTPNWLLLIWRRKKNEKAFY